MVGSIQQTCRLAAHRAILRRLLEPVNQSLRAACSTHNPVGMRSAADDEQRASHKDTIAYIEHEHERGRTEKSFPQPRRKEEGMAEPLATREWQREIFVG